MQSQSRAIAIGAVGERIGATWRSLYVVLLNAPIDLRCDTSYVARMYFRPRPALHEER
jgi:hypothetical protein